MKQKIDFALTELKNQGIPISDEFGIIQEAVAQAIGNHPEIPADWNAQRKFYGYIQLKLKSHNINPGPIDGYWGPRTSAALDRYLLLKENGGADKLIRPEEIVIPNPYNWPLQNPEQSMINFYGQPGDESNLIMANVPYPHKFSWNLSQSTMRFRCHKKVKDSIERVLNKVHAHYGLQEIQRLRLDIFGGCYNYRPMTGGNRLSTHSWGIALDYDPANNGYKWAHDKATFARPDYNRWWEFWEEEGWISLGRTRNFDWMHIQAARM